MNLSEHEPTVNENNIVPQGDAYPKEKTLFKQNNQQILSPFLKKEKRNRKFFMKRTTLLLLVDKETGDLKFEKGSDFAHLEIMQGGHFPMNKYAMKDIKSETFNNEIEARGHNVGRCLQQAALSLCFHCQSLNPQKQYKLITNSQSLYSEKSKQQQKINQVQTEKRTTLPIPNNTLISEQILHGQQENMIEELKILKDQLRKQHFAILQSII